MKLLTKDTDYAIRALLYLATRKKDEWVSSTEISTEDKIPLSYLRRILQVLKKEKYVDSKEGASGGLNVYTVDAYEFTKTDIDLLSAVANQAAVAIENTELMVKTKVIQEELESRKKVEKAKGILMKEQGLTEDQAYNLLRKTSMAKRVSMKDLADAMILSFEIRGDK